MPGEFTFNNAPVGSTLVSEQAIESVSEQMSTVSEKISQWMSN